MKKKAKRYAEGGEPKFEKSTYERAKEFLAKQGLADDTPSLDDRIARAKEKIEAFTQSTPESAAPRPRSASSAPSVSSAQRNAPAPEGTFTDSDVADRAERRARDEAENMARIEAVRNLDTADVKPPTASQAATSAPTSAARVGRAGQASGLSSLFRGGVHEQANEARIEARRRAEAEDKQRREEAAAARASAAQRSANIAEGRRNQEAAEAADARAAAAKAPGLGRAMMRRPSSQVEAPPAAPSRRFMADRIRRRVERPSGTESFSKGGSVPSASKRGDGIAKRGKTRGRMI